MTHTGAPVAARQHRGGHGDLGPAVAVDADRRRARARAAQSRVQRARRDEDGGTLRISAQTQVLEGQPEGLQRRTCRDAASPTPAPAWRPKSWSACSSRSSRPRASAKAPGSASARCSASPSSRRRDHGGIEAGQRYDLHPLPAGELGARGRGEQANGLSLRRPDPDRRGRHARRRAGGGAVRARLRRTKSPAAQKGRSRSCARTARVDAGYFPTSSCRAA